ncbi:unnamed protein product [Tilletia laevis]|uniref:Protein kinase domain-containing protein n=1 Tax=Tilletia laevis TaxID=157183 RepID=A0A9N8QAE0_9BASI|nr:unnamed protein product [Tilletia caries]CAD6910649.1 unnamed protein product [Tilletia laevis]CAD6921131.1 unnamed protein product [Tilletia caries]CAD7060318.1 unnamed protein product [Tilletia caries]
MADSADRFNMDADSSIISLPPASSSSSSSFPSPSPSSADPSQLQLVLRTSDHAAFYDRTARLVTLHSSTDLIAPPPPPQQQSNSLALLPHQPAGPLTTIASSSPSSTPALDTAISAQHSTCPTCLRPLLPTYHKPQSDIRPTSAPPWRLPPPKHTNNTISDLTDDDDSHQQGVQQTYVAPNYFRLLASASVPPSRASSRPGTPIVALVADDDDDDEEEEEVIQYAAIDSDHERERERIDGDSSVLSIQREMPFQQSQPQAQAPSHPRTRGLLPSSRSSTSTAIPRVIADIPPPRNGTDTARRTSTTRNRTRERERERLQSSQFSQGYFDRFFVRVRKLGRGARGTVWLCQHILGGQKLGEYAVKQVPVGDYADNLLASLKEVQMLETLRHPNIIHYQHAWIEEAQISPFAPRVPTLHVLMMAANGGSLADWISARAGNPVSTSARNSKSSQEPDEEEEEQRRSPDEDEDRPLRAGFKHVLADDDHAPPSPRLEAQKLKNERLKKAVRLRRIQRRNTVEQQQQREAGGEREGGAGESDGVLSSSAPGPSGCASTLPAAAAGNNDDDEPPHAQHLLGEGELFSLLRDMASGLGWLHERGVLHLDVKPENVLLHWEQADDLLPRAMLSDFGSSTFLQGNWRRIRSGHTGTMDFMAPEAIFPDRLTGELQELTSKSDVWSLGMILHLCVFFRLPYRHSDDIDRLREEMERYRGYSVRDERNMNRARVPPTLSMLLHRMLDRNPAHRPSCEEIVGVLASASASADDASAGGRWVLVLALAVLRSVLMEAALGMGLVGGAAVWGCGVVGLVEVALASRRPQIASGLFLVSLSVQVAIFSVSFARRSSPITT